MFAARFARSAITGESRRPLDALHIQPAIRDVEHERHRTSAPNTIRATRQITDRVAAAATTHLSFELPGIQGGARHEVVTETHVTTGGHHLGGVVELPLPAIGRAVAVTVVESRIEISPAVRAVRRGDLRDPRIERGHRDRLQRQRRAALRGCEADHRLRIERLDHGPGEERMGLGRRVDVIEENVARRITAAPS